MQTTHSRDSFHILRRQIVLLLIALCMCGAASAQKKKMPHMIDHDQKKRYFGLSFTANSSSYRILKSDYFANHDSVMTLNPIKRPGFGVGLLGVLRLTNRFNLRLVPTIQLADRSIVYVSNEYGAAPNVEKTHRAESILFHIPLSLILKSDRINDFRFYGLAGVKLDWDMNSNARSRKLNEVIKVKPIDLGYEVGAGLEFYFTNFILSPEIKLSRGLSNINIQDPDINSQVSRAIEDLRTYIWMFTINLKG